MNNPILDLRLQLGLSRKQLAESLGITRMSIWNYENFKKCPHPMIIFRFTEFLQDKHQITLPPRYFFDIYGKKHFKLRRV